MKSEPAIRNLAPDARVRCEWRFSEPQRVRAVEDH
jgi:hypothetical protein